ncbi:hypothetical protein BRAO285_720034 [Bradyrhizobium sp. ORS 285]|nr:hypothetical protein BRAO285_720034 [Bradyrhizobium sp. ORS 285]
MDEPGGGEGLGGRLTTRRQSGGRDGRYSDPRLGRGHRGIAAAQARRLGRSLDQYLLDLVEELAREEQAALDDIVPFGTWLYTITRPGVDIEAALEWIRGGPPTSDQ